MVPINLIDFRSLILSGAEYQGYNEHADLITETSDGAPLNAMWDEFQRIIAQWNAQRDPYISYLTFPVTQPIESVRYPVEHDFEEASEYGEPKGIRLPPSFRMGYDFKWYDLAVRYTWRFLLDASSDQLRALQNEALEADNRLMFSRIMKAIFNNVTRVAEIDNENINVYPFYNGDSQVPPKWKNTTHATAHQHYITSGAATVDSGDLEAMLTHVTHHGYTVLNGYNLVLMVNPQEGDVIRTFTTGGGDKYTFIPTDNVGGGVFLPANSGIVGRPTIATVPGLPTIGTWGPLSVVEDEYIPAGYMVLLVSGGEDSINNPIGIRQHERQQGLSLVKGVTPDYPLMDSYYIHGFGTGIRHRGAGVVMEVTTDGTYDIPAEYV